MPAGFLDDREQARQLRTCLNDTDMPLDLRIAGALVLVYGLPLSKIAYLTRDDITRHDGQTWLRRHGRQILLPPRLAALIGQLAPPARPWHHSHPPRRAAELAVPRQRPHPAGQPRSPPHGAAPAGHHHSRRTQYRRWRARRRATRPRPGGDNRAAHLHGHPLDTQHPPRLD